MKTDIIFNNIRYQIVYTGKVSCDNCDLKRDVHCSDDSEDSDNYCDLGYIYKRTKELREDKIKQIFS